MEKRMWTTVILFLLSTYYPTSFGLVKRCFSCRSRGELGDCGDPFTLDEYNIGKVRSVITTPCASGWCGKIEEGLKDDYGLATQRLCLPRPPNDLEERCAITVWQRRKVHMCMCKGDLCNNSVTAKANVSLMAFASIILFCIFKFS